MSERDVRTCKVCGRKYEVMNSGDMYQGGKEKEEIFCPWCGHEDGEIMTSGVVRTVKVEEDDVE